MLRAVLDTNVLISALLKIPSIPQQLYSAFKDKQFLLVVSLEIVAEVAEVLNRPEIITLSKMPENERKLFIERLLRLSLVTSGKTMVEIVKDDPDDNKFLACAVEGKAEYVVSGDKHLLNVKEYNGVKIVTPKEFVGVLWRR